MNNPSFSQFWEVDSAQVTMVHFSKGRSQLLPVRMIAAKKLL